MPAPSRRTVFGLLAVSTAFALMLQAAAVWLYLQDPNYPEPLIVRAFDPSLASEDRALRDALAIAVRGPVPPSADDASIGRLADGEFRARVRRVPGWEQLVALAPRRTAEALANHPAITSWWLRRRLSVLEGAPADDRWRLLAIRDQAVVADLTLRGEIVGGHALFPREVPRDP